MPSSSPSLLSRIQANLGIIAELRREALTSVLHLALGRTQADSATRLEIVSRFEGYEHEFWTAAKVEMELISNGRTETASDAPLAHLAVSTPLSASDASSAVRRASPSPAHEAPAENMTSEFVVRPSGRSEQGDDGLKPELPTSPPAAGEVF